MSKQPKPYTIKVVGQAESHFSGARPQDSELLIQKPDKNTANLLYDIVKTQIELCCQKGDTIGAMEALQKYQERDFQYANPLNVFQRDVFTGKAPFIGGYCVFGAIRDAMKLAFSDRIQFYKKKGDDAPSAKHLRKALVVRPNHIFFYRPDITGALITDIDNIDGQQPVGEVRGFARYEVIYNPFQFQFQVTVMPVGPFASLGDQDLMTEVIKQAAVHGLGSRRGAGHGMWRVVSVEVE